MEKHRGGKMKEWVEEIKKRCLKIIDEYEGTPETCDNEKEKLDLIAEIEEWQEKIEKLENVKKKAEILCKAIIATDYRIDCFNVIIPKEMVKYLQQAIIETRE